MYFRYRSDIIPINHVGLRAGQSAFTSLPSCLTYAVAELTKEWVLASKYRANPSSDLGYQVLLCAVIVQHSIYDSPCRIARLKKAPLHPFRRPCYTVPNGCSAFLTHLINLVVIFVVILAIILVLQPSTFFSLLYPNQALLRRNHPPLPLPRPLRSTQPLDLVHPHQFPVGSRNSTIRYG